MAHIAQRRFGQNFLVDKNIAKKIIKQAGIQQGEVVIEIGPGRGAITQMLAMQAKRVIAIELDKDLIQPLETLLSDFPNTKLVSGDVLKCYSKIVADIDGTSYLVVANIPYNITSLIIRTILQTSPPASRAILMVQKEVAMRMISKPGDMNLLSLSVQLYGEVKKCFDVAPSAFSPRPKVHSAVVELTPFEHPTTNINPEKILLLARYGFAKKRKLLASNISDGISKSRTDVLSAMMICEVPSKARAQDLSVDQWTRLAVQIYK